MADQALEEQSNEPGNMIERLPLEHPLPTEIQKMTRDDTVCKYCGISYFIHHEVKALEEKVKSLEKDLVGYQEAIEREGVLESQIRSLEEKLAESQQLIKIKDDVILKHENNLRNNTKKLQNLNETKAQLQDQLHEEFTKNSNLRKENNTMKSRLPDLMAIVKKQRSELTNIHTFVSQKSKLVHETIATLNTSVVSVCERELSAKESLKNEFSSLKEELQTIKEENNLLRSSKKNCEASEAQIKDLEGQLVTSKKLCDKLCTEVNKLHNDADEAVNKCRVTQSEAAQIKEQLRRKTLELEDVHEQQRKKDLVSEQMFSKYQLELKQKSEELRLANLEVKNSKQKMLDQNRVEEEIQRRAEERLHETEGVRETLRKTKEECRALKDEREMMITSHQNRIEQLRESFKQKLMEAEKWPEKMSEESRKEKNRHAQELKNLEESLKDAFLMEMDIEKHRCEELIEKYKEEIKDVDLMAKNEFKKVSNKHKLEVARLQKQADEAKSSVNEIEMSFKNEISSLKNIITNLQDKLAHVDRDKDGTLANLRAELREAENDLGSVKEENRKLEEKINDAKEEIVFLQETVRKECEERFELTEALSQAREQLLSYQRSTGSYSPGSRTSLNSRPNTASRPTHPLSSSKNHSKELLGNLDVNSTNGASVLGAHLSRNSASSVIPSRVSASNVNIDFNIGNSKPKNNGSKGMSMKDSRQRIAAAVGRK